MDIMIDEKTNYQIIKKDLLNIYTHWRKIKTGRKCNKMLTESCIFLFSKLSFSDEKLKMFKYSLSAL